MSVASAPESCRRHGYAVVVVMISSDMLGDSRYHEDNKLNLKQLNSFY